MTDLPEITSVYPDEPEFPEVPLSANGSAYTRREDRHGVPLEYVGEKLASAIEQIHSLACRNPERVTELVPAMYYALVSYLALHNMLAKANDRGLPERLLSSDSEELTAWLSFVRDQGGVLGAEAL